ncbi:hypothetical protein JTB14_035805 [Gonioctena quinquepunctata]|nr:hypothetical protein JTB14_035805 [Gonioctena quinquepunctata]
MPETPQVAESSMSEELQAAESSQDHTSDLLPAYEESKKQSEEGYIEPQHSLQEKSKNPPQSQLPPTSREGENGKNQLPNTNNEEFPEKAPSQDF